MYRNEVMFRRAFSKFGNRNILTNHIILNTRTKMSSMSSTATNAIDRLMETTQLKISNDNAKRLVADGTTNQFMKVYQGASLEDRGKSLLYLSRFYGINHEMVLEQCDHILSKKDRPPETLSLIESRLRNSLQPSYVELFALIARLNNGVKFLIDMRYDALLASKSMQQTDSSLLHDFQDHLREALSLWFSVGLLSLNRITWNSPAVMLEKIGKYEAVHHVKNWVDLKRRLGSFRRCYAFTHSTMPMEPLIVLHVALTDKIEGNIKNILKYDTESRNDEERLSKVSTAIFYSITSTQKGLQGIELGLYLIQAVVKNLQQEIPHLSQYSSLSPIPGYRKWLLEQLGNAEGDEVLSVLQCDEVAALANSLNVNQQHVAAALKEIVIENTWMGKPDVSSILKMPLTKLCAYYLCHVKKRGYAWDPVSNFHLRNGATVWRVNWLADTSPNGFKQSCGIMVNYRYYLDEINDNSRNYILNKVVPISNQVKSIISVKSKL